MLTMGQTADLLKSKDNILILTHKNPDGDTVGSAAALCGALRQTGKTAYVMKNLTITAKLVPYTDSYYPPQDFSPEYICAVDIADLPLLNDDAEMYSGNIGLCIDHHPTNSLYAENTLLMPDAAACGEIVTDLCSALSVTLTPEIATAAYLAIATDTGCFKYSSTTAATHRIASELMNTGMDFYSINNRFFELKSHSRFVLERLLMETILFYHDGRVAIAHITDEMISLSGATEDDTENISAITREIEGVDIGVLIRQRGDQWKLSIRTSPAADASVICARHGGGGHARAAGCTIVTSLDETKKIIIETIDRYLEQIR